jgi:hypothetical protein
MGLAAATEKQALVWDPQGARRWRRWIGHTLRNGAAATEKQALVWDPQGGRRRGKQKQTWKGPFWRKQETAAKHGVRLKGWWIIE